MASVFITGICGFIGRAIAELATEQGYDVSGIDRAGRKRAGIRIEKADVRDRRTMLKLTKNVDYVIHTAAITSDIEFEKRLGYCYDINVNGFNSVIEAACANGCKKFVYASSSAVYRNIFSEDAVLDVNEQKNNYAKTKIINEMVAQSYNDLGRIDAIGTRYFNVYGSGELRKGNYASIITLFIRQAMKYNKITIYGTGNQSRDLIHVDDAAAITLALMKHGRAGIYNVGTGVSTSYNKIAKMISACRAVHIKTPLKTYQLFTKADTKKLKKTIGNYNFINIEEGIGKLVKNMPNAALY